MSQIIPPLRSPQGNFGRVEQALRDTIRLFHADGRLRPEDHALVAYLVSTAAVVDDGKAGAIMRKEYREALERLVERCERAGSAHLDLLADMRSTVGNAADAGETDAWAGGGGGGPEVGPAIHAVAAPGRRRRAGVAA